ncbi:MAG TPA: PQQ-dependent sugar dehydrogenase [Planctomycetota bacterium]|nr:PQQ-dependent sugar dehydrogenase [Planctomycetota bacterium]
MNYISRCLCLTLLCSTLSAATLPEGFAETTLATGLSSPVSMALAPDGRIFICEQAGHLKVWKNGAILPTPFVNLKVDSNGDRGLVAVALDPEFNQNGYVYLVYTVRGTPAHNVVSRFTADGDVAQTGSETVIFHISDLNTSVHHCVNSLGFGPDGKLYIGVGDNSDSANAQSFENMMGKMLRINRDGTIPSDNPYYNTLEGDLRAIWAIGFRNPFTFSFHPETRRMLINEVGFSTWEEINEGAAGANYGWPLSEGATTEPGQSTPVFAYGHGTTNETGCAITGGQFYEPQTQQFPAEYKGRYFFIDYCSAWIRMLDFSEGVRALPFGTGLAQYPLSLRVGPDGSLYYLSRGPNLFKGSLRRIQYSPAVVPTIVEQPSPTTVFTGDAATFSVVVTGAEPMNYQWQRDGQPITGANSSTLVLENVQLSDSGASFHCVISNAYGSATSDGATLTAVENQSPVLTIASPEDSGLYTAGSLIEFSASAFDPEDGPLGAEAFIWQIEQVRPSHARPLVQPIVGETSGSVVLPDVGQADPDVTYRFICTVRDSRGAETTLVRELQPRLVTLRFDSRVRGLTLQLDGHRFSGPAEFSGVAGFRRRISTETPQRLNGGIYDFMGWSDGGPIAHEIVTPQSDGTWLAEFVRRNPPSLSTIAHEPAAGIETGDLVTFTAVAAKHPHALTHTWHWTFGDGESAWTPDSAKHAFTDPGVYTVTLTIADEMGLSTTVSLDLQVRSSDVDGDGIPNRQDGDDDNDGFSDEAELAAGTDPLNAESVPGRPARSALLRRLSGVFYPDGKKPDTLSITSVLPEGVKLAEHLQIGIGERETRLAKMSPTRWASPDGAVLVVKRRKHADLEFALKWRAPGLLSVLGEKSQVLPLRITCGDDIFECKASVVTIAKGTSVRVQLQHAR